LASQMLGSSVRSKATAVRIQAYAHLLKWGE